eukprot:9581995-Alexandrium_andersonii.AAC.1
MSWEEQQGPSGLTVVVLGGPGVAARCFAAWGGLAALAAIALVVRTFTECLAPRARGLPSHSGSFAAA